MRSSVILVSIALLAGCIHLNTDTPRFEDREIAMVVRNANVSEIREGRLAREKASDQSVRDYASMMVSDHEAAQAKAEGELFKAEIESADSPLSRQLDAESGATADSLRNLTGRAFDRAYIQREIQLHARLLEVIDKELAPKAKKKVVKDVLKEMRTAVQHHLDRARQVAAGIPAQ
jgi:putative membrane protein